MCGRVRLRLPEFLVLGFDGKRRVEDTGGPKLPPMAPVFLVSTQHENGEVYSFRDRRIRVWRVNGRI